MEKEKADKKSHHFNGSSDSSGELQYYDQDMLAIKYEVYEAEYTDTNYNSGNEIDESSLTSELHIKSDTEELLASCASAKYVDHKSENSSSIKTEINLKENDHRIVLKTCYTCNVCNYSSTDINEWKTHSARHENASKLPTKGKETPSSAIEQNNELNKTSNLHFCIFCKAKVVKFAPHIIYHHSDEQEVQVIKSLTANSQERKNLFTDLRKRGEIMWRSEGASTTTSFTKDFSSCSNCMGVYTTAYIWRHKRQCTGAPNADYRARNRILSRYFALKDLKMDSQLKDKVFDKMRKDTLSLVAKSDPIICMCAAEFLKTHLNDAGVTNTSTKMRQLAKLLLQVEHYKPSVKNMFDLLRAINYSVIVDAVKIICNDLAEEDGNVPRQILNIINNLQQCCDIALKIIAKEESVSSLTPLIETEEDIVKLKTFICCNLKADIISMTPWTEQQKKVVRSYLETIRSMPKKEDILKLKESHPELLMDKTYLLIKIFAQNWYSKHKVKKKNCETVNNDNFILEKKPLIVGWTEEQKKIVDSYFEGHIKSGVSPRKNECLKLIRSHDQLFSNKNWEEIKVYVHNKYTKNSKVKVAPEQSINSALNKKRFINSKLQDDRNLISTKTKLIKRNKKRVCYFCHLKVADSARHLLRNHRDQVIFKHHTYAFIHDRYQDRLLAKFRIKKAFPAKVKKASQKTSKQVKNTFKKYVFCPYCRGYFRKLIFTAHREKCKITNILDAPQCNSDATPIAKTDKQVLLHSLSIKDILENKPLFRTASAGLSDKLICYYVDEIISKTNPDAVLDIGYTIINQLGNLLINLRQTTGVQSLIESLKPELFDSLVKVTKKICEYSPELDAYLFPQLLVKIGKHLKEICDLAIQLISIKSNILNVTNDEQTLRNLRRFRILIDNHWNNSNLLGRTYEYEYTE